MIIDLELCNEFLRPFEQVSDPGRSQSANHLNELGAVHGEEGDVGLIGHSLGQERLATACMWKKNMFKDI